MTDFSKCTLPVVTLEQVRDHALIFTLDAEKTGDYIAVAQGGERGRDRVFAVGIAATVVLDDGELYLVRELCSRWVEALPRLVGESWRDCWQRNRWDALCYDEFWSQPANLAMLDALQTHVNTNDVASGVCHEIARLETAALAHNCAFRWYVDCITFDAWWMNREVQLLGQRPMNYYRSGRYGCDVVDFDSAFMGAMALVTGAAVYSSSVDARADKASIRELASRVAPHSHDPIDDAIHIAAQFYYLPRVLRARIGAASPVAPRFAAGGGGGV